MTNRGMGRRQIHDTAWRERYPHPMISCMMPLFTLAIIAGIAWGAFAFWQTTLPRSVALPSVTGMPLPKALKTMQNAGLQVEIFEQRQSSETVAEGSVIRTQPEANRLVKQGRLVRLLVSSGSAYTRVPAVKMKTADEARELVIDADLQISEEVYQNSSTVPMDQVILVSPQAGTRLRRNATVKMVISKGSRDRSGSEDTVSNVVSGELPTDVAGEADVRIDVIDNDGRRNVYQAKHNPGDTVVQTVAGNGRKWKVEVYFGDRLILTQNY